MPPLAQAISGAEAERIWLAVGPESGLEDVEAEAFVGAGWRPASLGPRTLRAETAGVVAAAILLHRWGDLGSCRSGASGC